MKQLLREIDDKPSSVEIRAEGSILHDFYCGIEKIFERIALSIDKSFPKGEDWHTELLLQMARPFKKNPQYQVPMNAIIKNEINSVAINQKSLIKMQYTFSEEMN